MTDLASTALLSEERPGLIERIGKAIPDPMIIFAWLWVIFFALSVLFAGATYETRGADGTTSVQAVQSMATTENIRWIFDNMVLANFMSFGGGVLGIILLVSMAVGVAEHAGLLGALIKRAGAAIPSKWLNVSMLFLGIMSSLAVDAGYLILVPLAGLLYASLGKHPLVGMVAAFAGVSAGFSANLVPGTPIDVIMGVNAQAFASAQGVPFVGPDGQPLNAATMNYYFLAASTFLLAPLGAWVTTRFVEPRMTRVPYEVPSDINIGEFALTPEEKKGLRWAGLGLIASLGFYAALALGPLAAYTNPETGTEVVPYLERLVIFVAITFLVCGAAFGYASGRMKTSMDLFNGMVLQMNTMGYIIVLSFFAYNALSLFTQSGLGALMTHHGANLLVALRLDQATIPLLIGFVLLTATVNLLIAGLTSKWLLLGPLFVPMLYAVNPSFTPDVVTAAYRVADSSTNIITPMMIYMGIILAFMRRYVPKFTLGELIIAMFPFSVTFLIVWTAFLVAWVSLGIPLGF
jgi:aminobenzoyl-glutamate transport protein